jgi:hypothetical protein
MPKLHTGPKGGKYYKNSYGEKTYLKKATTKKRSATKRRSSFGEINEHDAYTKMIANFKDITLELELRNGNMIMNIDKRAEKAIEDLLIQIDEIPLAKMDSNSKEDLRTDLYAKVTKIATKLNLGDNPDVNRLIDCIEFFKFGAPKKIKPSRRESRSVNVPNKLQGTVFKSADERYAQKKVESSILDKLDDASKKKLVKDSDELYNRVKAGFSSGDALLMYQSYENKFNAMKRGAFNAIKNKPLTGKEQSILFIFENISRVSDINSKPIKENPDKLGILEVSISEKIIGSGKLFEHILSKSKTEIMSLREKCEQFLKDTDHIKSVVAVDLVRKPNPFSAEALQAAAAARQQRNGFGYYLGY